MASKRAVPEIVWCGETLEGYSFIIFGKYRGRSRRYWWWCCACWEGCEDAPVYELGDAYEEYADHRMLCPGQLASVVVGIIRAGADPSPGAGAAA